MQLFLIESIVKGFSSTDDKTVEQSMKRADKFLANHEMPKQTELADKDDSTSKKRKSKLYNFLALPQTCRQFEIIFIVVHPTKIHIRTEITNFYFSRLCSMCLNYQYYP